MELDNRFNLEFNQMLYDRYGSPEFISFRIVGETIKFYYIEISSEDGLDQLVYNKEDFKWEFVN